MKPRGLGRLGRVKVVVAGLLVAALGATVGCTPRQDPPPSASASAEVSTTGFALAETSMNALYVQGDSGGVSEQRVSVSKSDDGDLSIDISADEVSGVGEMSQAAAWNAVSVATLLTGAPLDTTYRFAYDGRIDGPSAGALTTVALLSLYYGHPLLPTVTMTGTINPMGTVGRVGGIPEKIQGVIDGGEITTVLIPTGMRNSPNSQGDLVDVVQLGSRGGVEVIEVGDLFEAYPLMTGEELPRPPAASAPVVTDAGYAKFKSEGDAMLASFARSEADFAALDPLMQDLGTQLVDEARTLADRARNLQTQGLQGGGFFDAAAASMLMSATVAAFEGFEAMLQQGDAFASRLDSAEAAEAEFIAFLDSLATYTPETLSDAEALITAYGNAFDAFSVLQYAIAGMQRIADAIAGAEYEDFEQLFVDAMTPLLYYDYARTQLAYTEAVFTIGRDNPGTAISEPEKLEATASFFRRAADANWAAFESGVLQPRAEAMGWSTDVYRDALGSVDLNVALAWTAQNSLPFIQEYTEGSGANAAYAALGYGYANYARNAVLIEKYYNNGILDENLQLTGVASDAVLTRALEIGREQTARALDVLSEQGTPAILTTGAFEQAGVAREGDVTDKFSAMMQYAGAFTLSRMLAFAGGFEDVGFE